MTDSVNWGVNGTVCNAQQYSQSLLSTAPNNTDEWITCLTHGDTIGLSLTAEASLLSCVSVIIIFTLMGWNIRWYRRNFPRGGWTLFQTPTDILMFALFFFDFWQGMGGVLDIRWAHDGIVTRGGYCTAQGIIQQTGEVGVALMTLLLAGHTFVAAMWQVGVKARGVAFGMVCLVCIFIALWVSIGASVNHKNYERPSPYWCWISPYHERDQLWGEYIWMWVALFASAILYIPVYFWAEGRLEVDEVSWYKFRIYQPDKEVEYAKRRSALGMLLYPVAYSFVVLPTSVSRWLEFRHHQVPSAAVFFGAVMFNLSGAINVLLFLIIRPQLLLFPRPVVLGEQQQESYELQHQGAGSPVLDGPANFQHSPEPTSAHLADEGTALNRASSRISSII